MPTVADRYELVREVGRGGVGVVWLADDTLLRRQVAMKQIGLLPGATEADVDRVRREARVSAMLSDEHVVLVYDLVQDTTGSSWLVMEYVDSHNLAEIVRDEGALPPDRAAGYIRQAALALAAAHRAGIVHRDVKPSNLLVRTDGLVKLSDFGIARVEHDQTLTVAGTLVGSPSYLAPEVASGAVATPSSDMWSLGATAFHAVEGQAPYSTDGPMVGTLYRIVNDEPPAPRRAGWLEPMIRGLMQRDADRRWSADQVIRFLQEREAPAVDGAGTQELAPVAAPRRPRTPLVLGAVGLVVLVALVVVGVVLANHGGGGGTASDRPSGGSSPSSTASSAPSPAAMTDFVQGYLSTVTDDPGRAFAMLTPAFQSTSGGIKGYESFWGTVRQATPSDIQADPAKLTVSYRVEYTMRKGKDMSDTVTVYLQQDGDGFKIAGDNDHPPA